NFMEIVVDVWLLSIIRSLGHELDQDFICGGIVILIKTSSLIVWSKTSLAAINISNLANNQGVLAAGNTLMNYNNISIFFSHSCLYVHFHNIDCGTTLMHHILNKYIASTIAYAGMPYLDYSNEDYICSNIEVAQSGATGTLF
ncbi:hypothetical protein ACJX0J_040146, partial [Zea mays]